MSTVVCMQMQYADMELYFSDKNQLMKLSDDAWEEHG